jgi:hypothetical protein
MNLLHLRVNANYSKLIKSGIDAYTAKFIAIKLRIMDILEVAVSDLGVLVNVWVDNKEVKYVFKFPV